MTTPSEKLRALVALGEKTTPGTWVADYDIEDFGTDDAWLARGQIACEELNVFDAGDDCRANDLEFTAAAKNALPDIAEAAKALEASTVFSGLNFVVQYRGLRNNSPGVWTSMPPFDSEDVANRYAGKSRCDHWEYRVVEVRATLAAEERS